MQTIFNYALLIFGFGFVIFWHELGHFLAAKWAGVKVEQFAVGFGQSLLTWRKGLGFRVGATVKEYEERARARLESLQSTSPRSPILALPSDMERLDAAATDIGLSPTEYRLNWVPLGGYVKMLGQDDTDPTATSTDSRSYNRKSVGKRMVIISAGVVMNIILAGALFCGLFLYGFKTPAAIVGQVMPNSPAQLAGLEVGDRLIELNGVVLHDFTKLTFNTPLLPPDTAVPIIIERDGQRITKTIRPVASEASRGMLSIGIAPPSRMAGPAAIFTPEEVAEARAGAKSLDTTDYALWSGATITSVQGTPVSTANTSAEIEGMRVLDKALQASGGKPIAIGIKTRDGRDEIVSTKPIWLPSSSGVLSFAGLSPRARIESIMKDSPVWETFQPGDVVTLIRDSAGNTVQNPSTQLFRQIVARAGQAGIKLDFELLRDGKIVEVKNVNPNYKIDRGLRGLNIQLSPEEACVVATPIDAPQQNASRPGLRSKIPPGTAVTRINGQTVETWSDVHRVLTAAVAGSPIEVAGTLNGQDLAVSFSLDEAEQTLLQSNRYTHSLPLEGMILPRKTNNPLQAVWWGVGETRDLILKTYVTLKRAFYDRSVPLANFSGPVGIVHAGSIFADRGTDWLFWFLAIISANLAVVNFLPIPVVDGGHFCFLLLEKIIGKAPSPRLMAAAQILGLVVILSFFVFVTYNDIANLLRL